MKTGFFGGFVLWLVAWALGAQNVSPRYLVRDLGPLPDRLLPGSPGFAPSAINDHGVVVGWAWAPSLAIHAFRLKDGLLSDLGVFPDAPPFFISYALALNNREQIVGQAQATSDLTLHPALFEDGKVIDLGVPVPVGEDSDAVAVNRSCQIVGGSWFSGGLHHAFLYSNGKMADLGTLPGGLSSEATAINDRGEVVGASDFMTPLGQNGSHAFLYHEGRMTDLGALPDGFQFSVASGINDADQIVGTSASIEPYRAFLFFRGTMTDLGTLGGPTSSATAINREGLIVGWADVAANDNHACVWSVSSRQGASKIAIHDLNALIPPIPGLVLLGGLAINNRGQILAIGQVSGQLRSFILDPIDKREGPDD
jgi:probable HAF family extracellular repeat protein